MIYKKGEVDMKVTEKNILIEKIIEDKKLGAPAMRILLWAMRNREFTAKDIMESLEMTLQQVNKVTNDLIDKGYIEKVGKMESGRVLYYSINPKAYEKGDLQVKIPTDPAELQKQIAALEWQLQQPNQPSKDVEIWKMTLEKLKAAQ